MKKSHPFTRGIALMVPIVPGVIPFGLIMGTAAANANLSLSETLGINLMVFAGASQLAAVDLMNQNTQSLVIVLTGLVINLRMLLYSAAMAPRLQGVSFWKKSFVAYFLTDQAYAVVASNEDLYASTSDMLVFYFGAAVFMSLAWHLSVILGFFFGNITPTSLSLDFAVPLSFMALTIPTLTSRIHIYVAIVASIFSVLLHDLPYHLGLLVTAVCSISIGALLLHYKNRRVL
ncbi:MAG: AzlC family ABC transporter permease [Bdellovibrionota bacterium]